MSCAHPECEKPVKARGLCNSHYKLLIANPKKPHRSCACGCGASTRFTFKHGHHTRLFSSAEQSRRAAQNTGDAMRDTGEGKTYRKRGGRHEHRVVAERELGRPLTSRDVVHHKNHDIRDNRPENLEVMTRTQHINEHRADLIEGRRRARP